MAKLKFAFECMNFRDTFMRPPCTLVQPSMQAVATDLHIPDFGIALETEIYS